MAGVSGKTVEVKLRLPADLNAVAMSRAQADGSSKSQAIISMIRAGIAAGSGQAPATREDVAALRDQMTAIAEFQKAQSIALMDGVRSAVADAPVRALPSGVSEEEAARMVDAARREAEAETREAMGLTVERVRIEERGRTAAEVGCAVDEARRDERRRAELRIAAARRDGEAQGYDRAVNEFKAMSPVRRVFCKL